MSVFFGIWNIPFCTANCLRVHFQECRISRFSRRTCPQTPLGRRNYSAWMCQPCSEITGLKVTVTKKKKPVRNLDDGKGIGGNGRLTNKLINKLQVYYGKAIRQNTHDIWLHVKMLSWPYGTIKSQQMKVQIVISSLFRGCPVLRGFTKKSTKVKNLHFVPAPSLGLSSTLR